jgi:hypothetical protein
MVRFDFGLTAKALEASPPMETFKYRWRLRPIIAD